MLIQSGEPVAVAEKGVEAAQSLLPTPPGCLSAPRKHIQESTLVHLFSCLHKFRLYHSGFLSFTIPAACSPVKMARLKQERWWNEGRRERHMDFTAVNPEGTREECPLVSSSFRWLLVILD